MDPNHPDSRPPHPDHHSNSHPNHHSSSPSNHHDQQPSRVTRTGPALQEMVLNKEIITDDYDRDLHLKIEVETRTYEAPKRQGPGSEGSIIYIIEITKSIFVPKDNQRPSEEMISQNTPDISVFWSSYRARSEREDVLWRETLRYEGSKMESIALLKQAYSDIKTKRALVDSVFNTLGAM